MRKSQLVIVSAAGFLTLVMIVMAGLGRVALSQSELGTTRLAASSAVVVGEQITKTFDLEDFQSVAIEGLWQVNLTQGDEWQVEVSHSEDLEDDLNVYVRGDRLVLNRRSSGASKVTLSMNGGVLAGSMAGAGTIGYYGTVAEERVRIAGIGRVNHLD